MSASENFEGALSTHWSHSKVEYKRRVTVARTVTARLSRFSDGTKAMLLCNLPARKSVPRSFLHLPFCDEGFDLIRFAQHLVHRVLMRSFCDDQVASVFFQPDILVLHESEQFIIGLQCFDFMRQRLAQNVADVMGAGFHQRFDTQ